ncbi:MAG: hypothetical protein M1827_003600 [Pycnora praestabilis]|nr:MAG: hypothetical protein M1827_003600 [Pycnora praestabilis]
MPNKWYRDSNNRLVSSPDSPESIEIGGVDPEAIASDCSEPETSEPPTIELEISGVGTPETDLVESDIDDFKIDLDIESDSSETGDLDSKLIGNNLIKSEHLQIKAESAVDSTTQSQPYHFPSTESTIDESFIGDTEVDPSIEGENGYSQEDEIDWFPKLRPGPATAVMYNSESRKRPTSGNYNEDASYQGRQAYNVPSQTFERSPSIEKLRGEEKREETQLVSRSGVNPDIQGSIALYHLENDMLDAFKEMMVGDGMSEEQKQEAYHEVVLIAESPRIDRNQDIQMRAIQLSFELYYLFTQKDHLASMINLLMRGDENIRTQAYMYLHNVLHFCMFPGDLFNKIKDILFANLGKTLGTNMASSPAEAEAIIRAVRYILKKYPDKFVPDLFAEDRIAKGSLVWLSDKYSEIITKPRKPIEGYRVKQEIDKAMENCISASKAKKHRAVYAGQLVAFWEDFMSRSSTGSIAALNCWMAYWGTSPKITSSEVTAAADFAEVQEFLEPLPTTAPKRKFETAFSPRYKSKTTSREHLDHDDREEPPSKRQSRSERSSRVLPDYSSLPNDIPNPDSNYSPTSPKYSASLKRNLLPLDPEPYSPDQYRKTSESQQNQATSYTEVPATAGRGRGGGYMGKNYDPSYHLSRGGRGGRGRGRGGRGEYESGREGRAWYGYGRGGSNTWRAPR